MDNLDLQGGISKIYWYRKNIEDILKTEFTKFNGKKIYLDFLCKLDDGTLCHIEFQFPYAKPKDMPRFFDYNLTAHVVHDETTDTYVVNFTSRKYEGKWFNIGKSKRFRTINIFLGDMDFKTHLNMIKDKVKSNINLNSSDEIDLMIMCLIPEYKNKFDILK